MGGLRFNLGIQGLGGLGLRGAGFGILIRIPKPWLLLCESETGVRKKS